MFWRIPLSDARYACGRVLQVEAGSRVTILAGLMSWVGASPPDSAGLAGSTVVSQGTAHVKTITETGGEILGYRDLALDDIEPLPMLSHSWPTGVRLPSGFEPPKARLVNGFHDVREATAREIESLPALSAWGYKVIQAEAENYFVAKTTHA